MSIRITRAGLLATIQDLGRHGFQQYGVIVSGTMDSISHRMANLVVGNKEAEAAIEVTLMGTAFQFEEDALISITGGDLNATIDNIPAPLWRPIYIRKGAILSFGSCSDGCRAYVAAAGGFAVPEIMNSKSTYLRGGIGGFKGRALQEGDRIPIAKAGSTSLKMKKVLQTKNSHFSFSTVDWYVPFKQHITGKLIRVIRGAEFEHFTNQCQKQFFDQEFQVTLQSDRMGYRLSGSLLQLKEPFELLSEAVTNGTIQVPADGNPIVLLADRQTTGGYPRIGQVATVDLPKMGQLKPGDRIRFEEITLIEAEKKDIERENQMSQIQTALRLKE